MPLFGRLFNKGLSAGVTVSLLVVSTLVAGKVDAGTIVRVSTTLGDYSIELLDDVAPLTVQNFLNYLNRGDYNQTYIHRSESNFVVQGGGYRFQPFEGPVDVPEDPPVQNEFNASNVRGTIAMAKLDGDPNSATSQWFVNILDNSANLDVTNGGFTVFGNILGDGMQVVDRINVLPTISLGPKASATPYATVGYTNPLDWVYINMEVVDRFSSALHVFEEARNLLITTVSVDNGAEYYSLNFSLVGNSPDVVFEANADSIIKLTTTPDGAATFSTTDNRLRIPVIELNYGSSIGQVTNVVLVRNAPDSFLFTLESYNP